MQGPSFYGVKCPASESLLIEGVGTPEYLSIVGHEHCLDEQQEDGFTSSCIPTVKPEDCQVDERNIEIEMGCVYLIC